MTGFADPSQDGDHIRPPSVASTQPSVPYVLVFYSTSTQPHWFRVSSSSSFSGTASPSLPSLANGLRRDAPGCATPQLFSSYDDPRRLVGWVASGSAAGDRSVAAADA